MKNRTRIHKKNKKNRTWLGIKKIKSQHRNKREKKAQELARHFERTLKL